MQKRARTRARACAGYAVAPRVGFHDDPGGITGIGQADLDLLPADHDCPAHGDRKIVRTARRCRAIEIQAGPHTISAADPLPDDLRHAIETIARAR
jgi:hypothetical protein